MSKGEAPPAPDYGPIAQADAAAAERQFQLGEEQLAFSKDQFNRVWPYAQAYLDYGLTTDQSQYNAAQRAEEMYETGYKPVEQQFLNEVKSYREPWRIEENASRAMADVGNTFQAARTAALAQLESYGIDPSTTRFGALDLTTRIQEAAAKAAAGTQSRLATEAQGLGLMGEAINVGRGYPGAIASSYKTATDAGKSTLGGANETGQTSAYMGGQPTSYFNAGNVALGNQANALNMGFNNAATSAQIQNQNSANFMSGIGKLIGGGLSAAMMFA
jgi:hypothetical protein